MDPGLKGRVDLTWGTKITVLPGGKAHAFQVILSKHALKVPTHAPESLALGGLDARASSGPSCSRRESDGGDLSAASLGGDTEPH